MIEALKMLKKEKGINYELTARYTIIEAQSLNLLLNIAKKMHLALFDEKVKRVITFEQISEKLGHRSSIVTKRYIGINQDEINKIEDEVCL